VLPNFFCVGAQKAGTTTLYNILKQHPDIFLPDLKETHFFFEEKQFKKGIEFYEETYFSNWKGEKAVGEIEPDYMYLNFIHERIASNIGRDVKLIFLLRNPVDRAFSQYLMNVRRGFESLGFLEALKLERERIKKDILSYKRFGYVQRGLYYKQIKKMLDFFPFENMFFVFFEEDFIKNRESTIKALLRFLEVSDKEELNLDIKSNSASVPRFRFLTKILYSQNIVKKIGRIILPDEIVRRKLFKKVDNFNTVPIKKPLLVRNVRKELYTNYFKEDIDKLEKLIKRDLSGWKEE